MPLYRRKFPCAVCGQDVYYDSVKQTIKCGCREVHVSNVDLTHFVRVPKYDRHIYREKLELPIDCAKYVTDSVLYICDRNSIVRQGEDPRLIVSWINYPKENKVQLKLAVTGNFHTEILNYYVKDPRNWKEKLWILIPEELVDKLIEFLQKNPMKLASWM